MNKHLPSPLPLGLRAYLEHAPRAGSHFQELWYMAENLQA